MKPPRFPSLFECLVNAVACQQLTLTVGIRLLNRLAAAHGAERDGVHAFPRPRDLAAVPPEALLPPGFSRAKARSIIGLAEATTTGEPVTRTSRRSPTRRRSCGCCACVASAAGAATTRCCAASAACTSSPATTSAPANHLARRLDRPGPLDSAAVREAVRPWQPFAGLVYFHPLLADLSERGLLDSGEPALVERRP